MKDIQQSSKPDQKSENSQNQTIGQHHFVESIQKQQEKELSFDKNQEDEDIDEKQQQINNFLTSTPRHHSSRRQQIVNNFNRNATNNINRRQHRTNIFPTDPSIVSYQEIRSDEKQGIHNSTHGSKPTELIIRNKK